MTARLDLRAYGDAGLLAGVLGEDYESRWRTTQALATAVRDADPTWLVDVIATYHDLLVTFDPGSCDHDAASALLEQLNDALAEGAVEDVENGRTFSVPVLFGGESGPDLEAVAAEVDLSPQALVEQLTAAPWRVRFVASPVGTPFTDRHDWTVTVPRMKEPRVSVPPGSVALSGSQSIIYPVPSPGGWRLVGRTPLRLVDATEETEELVGYRAGDQLRYEAIDQDRFAEIQEQDEQLGQPS